MQSDLRGTITVITYLFFRRTASQSSLFRSHYDRNHDISITVQFGVTRIKRIFYYYKKKKRKQIEKLHCGVIAGNCRLVTSRSEIERERRERPQLRSAQIKT